MPIQYLEEEWLSYSCVIFIQVHPVQLLSQVQTMMGKGRIAAAALLLFLEACSCVEGGRPGEDYKTLSLKL